VTTALSLLCAPTSSVTVSVAECVPADVKICETLAPLALPASLKLQVNEVTVPSGSEPPPLSSTGCPTVPDLSGPALAVGARLRIVTEAVSLAAMPSSSTTDSRTT
jgi:hypothetical protein